MRSNIGRVLLGGILATVMAMNTFPNHAAETAHSPFSMRQKVPPFPRELTWLNTTGPLELKDLHGKFVLLDFWTYCCINCMHILPELKKLEHAYPNNLVVLGVHSAKFAAERDEKNIAEAIRRYKIEHPVINDARHVLWNRFGVTAWPTVILIDPEGYAVWGTSGEITFDQIDKLLKMALPYYRHKKLLNETSLQFDFERRKVEPTPLEYPGKVLADEENDRLFIADSNHNRIVIAKLDGTLLDIIGSGAAGMRNGDFAAAEFNQPQGMALDGTLLYIADTANHVIRKADLTAKKVSTVAGVGRQNRDAPPVARRGDPLKMALSSPWDLIVAKGDLYIAMSGMHQIWKMKLDGSTIGPYAGNGREDIANGPLLPSQPYRLGYASFAQPSGLATDGTWLFVADSEGSSIRAVPLDPRRQVRTVVGTSHLMDNRLFTFGDTDGPALQTRFQHPLGVAFHGGKIYVADTYNSKIRVVDPTTGATSTFAGTGKAGRDDEPAAGFDEPAGISAVNGKLYLADTNHHLIRVIDIATKNVATLPIAGLKPPLHTVEKTRSLAGAIEEQVESAAVRPENGSVRFSLEIELPLGYKINTLAPMTYRLEKAQTLKKESSNGSGNVNVIGREAFGKAIPIIKPAGRVEIRLPLAAAEGRDTFRLILDYYYCLEGAEGLCKAGTVLWTIPLDVSAAADRTRIVLRHRVP